jgi:hypothetical protein
VPFYKSEINFIVIIITIVIFTEFISQVRPTIITRRDKNVPMVLHCVTSFVTKHTEGSAKHIRSVERHRRMETADVPHRGDSRKTWEEIKRDVKVT